jgi:hypothetical protein
MRVLTEYEEGGGPKQDILEADEEEEGMEDMEVDGGGVGGAGDSDSECDGPCVGLAPHASQPRRGHARLVTHGIRLVGVECVYRSRRVVSRARK